MNDCVLDGRLKELTQVFGLGCGTVDIVPGLVLVE